MELFEVNKSTCIRDGHCVASCPAALISFPKGEYPRPIDGAEDLCIRCGHCVAVCPTASLSHREMPVESCPPVRPDLRLTIDQCEHFLRARRSIRAYKKQAVPQDALRRLIDLASHAPTGHNSQCVEWLVLSDREELHKLASIVADWMRWMIAQMREYALSMHMDRTLSGWEAGRDVFLRNTPALVIAHAEKDNRMAPAACTIALTQLELAATALGLGGCWAGYFMAASSFFPPMTEALQLPAGHQCFGSLMLGYRKYDYHRLPLRLAPRITWR